MLQFNPFHSVLSPEPSALKRVAGTRKPHDRQVRTLCRECTVGCGLIASVKDDVIVDVQGDEAHPVSRGRLCARGTAFVQGLRGPERIAFPASRRRLAGPFEAVDNLDAAFDDLADRLRKVRETAGPESLYIGCDPEAGLDFHLGAVRFARLWGTPHVYHPLDLPPAVSVGGVMTSPARPCTDWVNAETLLMVEADVAATHPVAFGWALDAQRRGAGLVVADTRFTPTLAKADLPLMITPGSGNILGLLLIKVILDESLQDSAAVAATLNDPESWGETYGRLSLDDAEALTGLSADQVIALGRRLWREGPVTVVTGKRLAYLPYHRSWLTLASAMGWVGRPGGGWYPLEAGRPRLDAAGDIGEETAGPVPSADTVYPYQVRGPASPAAGEIRAIIGSGNCFNDFFRPFGDLARKLDLTVHFGAFPNRTRDLSHLVFPATLWPERDGIVFSNDRAVQWGPRIVQPTGACGTGLDFWTRLAARLGWDDHFPWRLETGAADVSAFYDWLLDRTPETAGIRVEALRSAEPGSITRWPSDPDADIRPTPPEYGRFANRPYRIDPQPAPETLTPPPESPDYPLVFQATRVAPRSGDAGHRWPWIEELTPTDWVQIHPDTAAALCIDEGAEVRVVGPGVVLTGRAWISRMVPPRTVWAAERLGVDRVLVHRAGQSREEAISCLGS